MSQLRSRWLPLALLSTGICVSLNAVDGVVLISQVQALAGNVTPGDTPGFPVTISVPGSYRLSGNLTVPDANTTAILITADNVTLDLNGFSIIGPTVCTGDPTVTSCSPIGANGYGVNAQGQNSITVINGSIRGMGNGGVLSVGNSGIVERVNAYSNGIIGIEVFGAVVRGCTANFNGPGGGFSVDRDSTVTGNTANGNQGDGFTVSSSTVSGNTANSNKNRGFFVFCPSTIIGNTAVRNVLGNLFLDTMPTTCTVANNTAP